MRIGVKDVKESKAIIVMGVLPGVFLVILMIMAVKKKDVRNDKKETLQEQSTRLKY